MTKPTDPKWRPAGARAGAAGVSGATPQKTYGSAQRALKYFARREKLPPSPSDLMASQRLKALWLAMPNRPTQQQLAEAWPYSASEANQSLISQYMNGKIALNHRALLFFADQLGVPPEAIRDDLPELRLQYRVSDAPAHYEVGWDDVRGYAQAAGLGAGAEAEEYADTHKLKFRAESLRRKGLVPRNLCVYYGQGDSMEPRIREGDAILFDTSDTTPKDGAIFIVQHGREILAKRCEVLDGTAYFRSDNPNGDHNWRKPKRLDNPRDPLQILGRVRWIAGWED